MHAARRLVVGPSKQCRALLELGFWWSARDYATTGDYFQAALTIARDLADPATLVAALNRAGSSTIGRR